MNELGQFLFLDVRNCYMILSGSVPCKFPNKSGMNVYDMVHSVNLYVLNITSV
jgi:hypothetical protein